MIILVASQAEPAAAIVAGGPKESIDGPSKTWLSSRITFEATNDANRSDNRISSVSFFSRDLTEMSGVKLIAFSTLIC
jgi:hypothetical protein